MAIEKKPKRTLKTADSTLTTVNVHSEMLESLTTELSEIKNNITKSNNDLSRILSTEIDEKIQAKMNNNIFDFNQNLSNEIIDTLTKVIEKNISNVKNQVSLDMLALEERLRSEILDTTTFIKKLQTRLILFNSVKIFLMTMAIFAIISKLGT